MSLFNGSECTRRDGQPFRLLVEQNWDVADIKTVAECDLATKVLETAIRDIDASLAAARTKPTVNPDWFRRASSAVRLKRVALKRVAQIRERLVQQQSNLDA
jgi:hypothetical protein